MEGSHLVRSYSARIREESLINELFFGSSTVKMCYPLSD